MKLDKYYNSQDASEEKKGDGEQEQKAEEPEKAGSFRSVAKKLDTLLENKYLVIGIAIIIILADILLRTGLLQYQGLFEPDGFFYYSVIRQAISNHFIVSNYLNISGFPAHNFIGEAPGLPYLTVIAYYFLHGITGLSALTIMRWMPILFGVLYAILAYFLARFLTKSRVLGLIAMLFVAISSGNIARTAGAVYRGDSFISLFILLALFFMLKCFEEKKQNWKYAWAVLSAITLSLGIVIWNGAPFIMVVYMLALLLVIIYGFIKADLEILFSSIIISLSLILTHLLQIIYISLVLARSGLELSGNDFFIFYVPIILGALATYYIVKNIHKFKIVSSERNRFFGTLGVAILGFIVIFAFFGSTLINIASPVGPIIASANTSNATARGNAITATTQELQKPTYSFLWASFNIQLYLSIIGVILFVLFAFLLSKNERIIKKEHFKLNNVAFLVIFAYFLVTAYLQWSAIRFNAIISLPLAIFAAFAVYGIGKMFYHQNVKGGRAILLGAVAIIIAAGLLYNIYNAFGSPFKVVLTSAVLIYLLLIALCIYGIYAIIKRRIKLKYVVLALVLVVLLYNFYNTYFESVTAVQADGINPSFLSAAAWLGNNTPSNATVLALWPDGSVIEAWGNRTSFTDSVGGENGTKIYYFSRWLFDTSDNTSYLYQIHKPEYLFVRNFWYAELGGIAEEGLVQNTTEYGYIVLNGLNTTANATTQIFVFQSDQPPYYKSELLIQKPSNNSTSTFSAYLGISNSTRLTQIKSVIFYNSSDFAYTETNATTNITLNYTLLVSFDGGVVNGGYILGPKLVESNIFKFTFLCGEVSCPYDNSNVTLTSVFANGDSKIFKINYLNNTG